MRTNRLVCVAYARLCTRMLADALARLQFKDFFLHAYRCTLACLRLCLCLHSLSDTYAMSCHVGLQGSVETYIETYVSLVQTCTCVSVSVDCSCGSRDPELRPIQANSGEFSLVFFELMRDPLLSARSLPAPSAPGQYGQVSSQTLRCLEGKAVRLLSRPPRPTL